MWAEAYKTRPVPQVVMGGGSDGGTDSDTQQFIELLTLDAARDLSLDLSTK